jgi:protein-S-isoprenylcysteine O-methyltransferase Ste14
MLDRTVAVLAFVFGCSPFLLMLAGTWILVGTTLEERDLAAEMGPPYEAYRRQVPMLIPWRQPSSS